MSFTYTFSLFYFASFGDSKQRTPKLFLRLASAVYSPQTWHRTMQGRRPFVLLALLSLSSAAALTCRPQLRASQPAKCVRASPPSMTSEADLLRLQEEIQRLQLQAEIIRLQAQAEAAAVAAPIVTPPEVAAPIVPPPAVVALPQLTAPVPEPVAAAADVAERIVDAVKDTLLPSSSPIDDVAAAAAAAAGAGAQELVLNIDSANSVGLDRVRSRSYSMQTHHALRHTVHAPMAQAYPLLVLLGLSILPLLLSIANAAAKAVTGKSLFLGRIDTYDPRGPSSKVRARPAHLGRTCTACTLYMRTAHRLHIHCSLAW